VQDLVEEVGGVQVEGVDERGGCRVPRGHHVPARVWPREEVHLPTSPHANNKPSFSPKLDFAPRQGTPEVGELRIRIAGKVNLRSEN
jgi:hypothetical protein